METARRATEADIPALTSLWRLAVADTELRRGGAALLTDGHRPEPLSEELLGDLDDSDRLLVAGCIDAEVVGVGAARTRRIGPGPLTGVVELLFVDPEARAVGVGEAIMDVVTEWCHAAGCTGIDAPALPGSRQAKAFFETSGFVTRLLIMHRPLGTTGGVTR